jgi:hypothetical protein
MKRRKHVAVELGRDFRIMKITVERKRKLAVGMLLMAKVILGL